MQVPTYQARVNPVQSNPLPVLNPGYEQQMIQDVTNAANVVVDEVQKYNDKIDDIKVTDYQSELSKETNRIFLETTMNRQGQDALGNEVEGVDDLYTDMNKQVKEAATSLKSQYGFSKYGEARAQETANKMMADNDGRFASAQAGAIQQAREDAVNNSVAAATQDAAMIGKQRGSIENITVAINEAKQVIRENSGGRDVSSKEAQVEAELTKVWILNLADEDPEMAQQYEDKLAETLSPEALYMVKNRIEQNILRDNVEMYYDEIYSSSGDFESRMIAAGKIEDKQTRDRVTQLLVSDNNEVKRIESEISAKTYSDLWTHIANKGEVTPAFIDGIVNNDNLSESQREHLVNMVNSGADSPDIERNRQQNLYEMKMAMIRGEVDMDDVNDSYNRSELPNSALSTMYTFSENLKKFPDVGKAVSIAIEQHSRTFRRAESKAEFLEVLYNNIVDYREKTGGMPDASQVIGVVNVLTEKEIKFNIMHPTTWNSGRVYQEGTGKNYFLRDIEKQYEDAGILVPGKHAGFNKAVSGWIIGRDKDDKNTYVVIGTDGKAKKYAIPKGAL